MRTQCQQPPPPLPPPNKPEDVHANHAQDKEGAEDAEENGILQLRVVEDLGGKRGHPNLARRLRKERQKLHRQQGYGGRVEVVGAADGHRGVDGVALGCLGLLHLANVNRRRKVGEEKVHEHWRHQPEDSHDKAGGVELVHVLAEDVEVHVQQHDVQRRPNHNPQHAHRHDHGDDPVACGLSTRKKN